MDHQKFRVSDYVENVSCAKVPVGLEGLVLEDCSDGTYLVQFYGWNGGHSGGKLDSTRDKYYMGDEEIKLISTESTDGDNYVVNGVRDTTLPTDAKERKDVPLMTGVVDYFTSALIEVAKVSKQGNDQHNPGQPLGWDRDKSIDHADCALRHLAERGTIDTDGQRHTAKAAWRILAELQTELERDGAPLSRGSR